MTSDHIGALCDAMRERVYGHPVSTCEEWCTEPVFDFATEARAVLESTDPAVHAALLDALVRAGVLTWQYDALDRRPAAGLIPRGRNNGIRWAAKRLVSPWQPDEGEVTP